MDILALHRKDNKAYKTSNEKNQQKYIAENEKINRFLKSKNMLYKFFKIRFYLDSIIIPIENNDKILGISYSENASQIGVQISKPVKAGKLSIASRKTLNISSCNAKPIIYLFSFETFSLLLTIVFCGNNRARVVEIIVKSSIFSCYILYRFKTVMKVVRQFSSILLYIPSRCIPTI